MISTKSTYLVTGLDRAAAFVRPLLAPRAVWLTGVGVCPQPADLPAGMPATPMAAARRRDVVTHVPSVKSNTFEIQPDSGSTVWRPPV